MNRYLTALGLSVFVTAGIALVSFTQAARSDEKPAEESKDLLTELKNYPQKLSTKQIATAIGSFTCATPTVPIPSI